MNKVLENLLETGFVDKEAKELGLKCRPSFKYGETDVVYMKAIWNAQTTTYGMSCHMFLSTTTDGAINVNGRLLSKLQKAYTYRCGTMDAAMDVTKIVLLHELRHLFQYENGMWIGYTYNPIVSKENTRMEKDANDYAIEHSNTERMQSMAQAFVMEHGGECTIKELRKAMHTMEMLYNPTWTITGRILGLL